jgi:hypothetical protein
MSTSVPNRGGVEGKWEALLEERQELREKVEALEKELESLRTRNTALESGEVAELTDKLEEMRAREREEASDLLVLNEDEQEAMDGVLTAFNIIANRWKLKSNHAELTSAVHTVQGFVIQHMITRLSPKWGNWWQDTQEHPVQRKGT